MILRCEPLEGRDVPAAWYGGEFWHAGHAIRPFEDWGGSLQTMEAGGLLYVAPGNGGGPRVATFDTASVVRTRPDYWAGDPADRSGVVFVGVQLAGMGPPIPANYPPIEYGSADRFTIFVDFEAPADQAAVLAELHALVPSVRLTNRRPDGIPRDYGTAVFVDSRLAPYPLAGTAYADWTRDLPQVGVSESVFVDASYTRTSSDAARMLAHEIFHGLKLIPDEA